MDGLSPMPGVALVTRRAGITRRNRSHREVYEAIC